MESNNVIEEELKELNKTLKKLYRLETVSQSFFRGMMQGLGSVVGATLVVGVLVYFVSHIQLIPIIGNWLADIVKQVQFNLMYK